MKMDKFYLNNLSDQNYLKKTLLPGKIPFQTLKNYKFESGCLWNNLN